MPPPKVPLASRNRLLSCFVTMSYTSRLFIMRITSLASRLLLAICSPTLLHYGRNDNMSLFDETRALRQLARVWRDSDMLFVAVNQPPLPSCLKLMSCSLMTFTWRPCCLSASHSCFDPCAIHRWRKISTNYLNDINSAYALLICVRIFVIYLRSFLRGPPLSSLHRLKMFFAPSDWYHSSFFL